MSRGCFHALNGCSSLASHADLRTVVFLAPWLVCALLAWCMWVVLAATEAEVTHGQGSF